MVVWSGRFCGGPGVSTVWSPLAAAGGWPPCGGLAGSLALCGGLAGGLALYGGLAGRLAGPGQQRTGRRGRSPGDDQQDLGGGPG